jgi:hypothetical protein
VHARRTACNPICQSFGKSKEKRFQIGIFGPADGARRMHESRNPQFARDRAAPSVTAHATVSPRRRPCVTLRDVSSRPSGRYSPSTSSVVPRRESLHERDAGAWSFSRWRV